MKFVAISDTHCKHRSIQLPRGDVLIHAGDITTKGKRDEVAAFLSWFDRQPFRYKIFIAGNHDFFFEKASAAALQELIPPGITYLNDSGVNIEGLSVWGSPVTPTFFNWAFNRSRGAGIRKHWDLIPGDTDLLITHGPVHGFLDLTSTDQHVGCPDLLRKVLTIQPRVHVCGHIHESYGTVTRSGIRFVNACMVNDQYDLVNKPLVFTI